LGFVDNVIRDIVWESPDYIRIANVRREAMVNLAQDPTITGAWY